MIALSNTSRRGPRERLPRTNGQIRAKEVLLVDPTGEQIGVKSLDEALWLAGELGLDLVEVNRDAKPPVVRVMDYGKFRYEQSKKAREARKKRKPEEKTVQFSPSIADGDYDTKLRKIKDFLDGGHNVIISMRFKGREMSHMDLGWDIITRLQHDVVEHGTVDVEPRRDGRRIIMKFRP